MRRLLAAALLAMWAGCPRIVVAQSDPGHARHPAAHGPSWGVHGMVLFGGRDGLFASHLPLFRAPHDRQLILELALDDPAADAAVRQALAGQLDQLWTIEPERFELARLWSNAADPLRHFRAIAVRGHFERGGTPVFPDLRFRVVRIITDRPLDPSPRARATATYDRVGRGDAQFLVKRLDARPDFDHIVRVKADRCPVTIEVQRSGVSAPTATALGTAGGCATAIGPSIYYEIDDLR